MTAKEYLRQVRKLDISIEQLEERHAEIWTELTRITVAPDKEHVDGGATSTRKESLLDALTELDDRIEQQRFEALQTRATIQRQVLALKDPLHVWILGSLYLDWKENREIEMLADRAPFYYSRGYIYQKHGEALQAFAELLKHSKIEI